jgi:cyanate permease
MLAIVGLADGWRLVLLAALVAVAVAATRLWFGGRAALGLLMAVALLAIAGWGPGFDRRPSAAPVRLTHVHADTPTHRTKR